MRKLLMVAGIAGAMLVGTTSAHAAAYFIGGKWYYFSLNFEALIAKVTGKDLKLGTFVGAEVKILTSDVQCSNPQNNVINGNGPRGVAYGSSPDVQSGDFVKSDRQNGNIFQTTTTVLDLVPEAQRLNPPSGLCKNAPGASQWFPLFWQDRECDKAKAPGELSGAICYKERAAFINGTLTYVTGTDIGRPVIYNTNPASWTFVYLPRTFKYKATLNNDQTQGYSNLYGQCGFPPNNEPGAAQPGEPYSIANPPVNGWAALPPVSYECAPITEAQYAAP